MTLTKINKLKHTHYGADFLLLASIMMTCPAYSHAQESQASYGYGEEYFSLDSPIVRDKEAQFQRWIRQALDEADTIRKSTNPKIKKWHDSVTGLQQALRNNPRTALEKINTATNRLVPYKTDAEIYNQSDYWSSPVKTLLNGGDCEDFALLNVIALILNGWPTDKTHILIGYTMIEGRRQPHAVLQVETTQGRLILNNMNNRITAFAESGIDLIYMIDSQGAIIFPKRAAR